MALVQLMAKGVQDVPLTSSPQFSLFKQQHKRHTPFAVEWAEESFLGEAKYGQRCVVEINKASDLVRNIILEATMTRTGKTFFPMEELIELVEIFIGGVKVTHYDSTWCRIYDEMYRPFEEQMAYREMCDFTNEPMGNTKTLRIPLLFWFNRHAAQALPLIALAYSTVEIVFHFAKSVRGVDTSTDPNFRVHVERIFLDNKERALFGKCKHSYMFEQLQMHKSPTLDIQQKDSQLLKLNLPFNHPTKSLIFCFTAPWEHGVFASSLLPYESREVYGILKSAKLVINGVDRQEEKSGSWLRNVENFLRLGTTPSVGVYSMHFCLHPRDSITPSGSLNMSQFESELFLTLKSTTALTTDEVKNVDAETVQAATALSYINLYAVNWNQLNITQGMAGVRWSN